MVKRALFGLLLAGTTACATTRSATTWEDDAAEGLLSRTRSSSVTVDGGEEGADWIAVEGPLGRATPTRGPKPRADAPALDPEELELALIRFSTKRRSLSSAGALHDAGQGPSRWPRPLEVAFTSVFDVLERAFAAPAGSVARRVLIQSRVTIEVELSSAEARFGPAPDDVARRVMPLFASIAMHMRASAPVRAARRASEHAIALSWPVSPVIVTSPFGYRRDPILGRRDVRFHAGVDLGGDPGAPVHAAGPGRVVHAGWLGGHGRAVIVQHAGGYSTTYAHLKQVLTSLGAEVDTDDAIGLVGNSGRSTGPHLHFEVRHGGAPLDPQEVVETRYVRTLSAPAEEPEDLAVR
ncbi:M23 family metallopeptidase [Myxococcota bacterium]|nr:M23 family metallopeptidase [Myxococcota bacterium]